MEMPQFVKDAHVKADAAADASQAAWDELNAIESASLQDIEKWIAARDRAHKAQDYFIALIRHVKFQEPYPVAPQD